VQEYRLLQSFHDGHFKPEQLFGFPLPESIGIRFDRAHGHKIAEVIPDSPAASAGLVSGDVVTRAGDVPVRSEQDLQWALHRLPENDPPQVTVERAESNAASGRSVVVKLSPARNWRQTELGWRKSLRSVPLPLGFLGYPLGGEERRTAKFPVDRLAIRVVSIRADAATGTRGLAGNLGLEKGDLIVSLAGHDEARSLDEFKSDLVRRFSPGEKVVMLVLRDGQRVELEGPFPDWHTSDTSVP
jgi:S1-C subfamily serine protease